MSRGIHDSAVSIGIQTQPEPSWPNQTAGEKPPQQRIIRAVDACSGLGDAGRPGRAKTRPRPFKIGRLASGREDHDIGVDPALGGQVQPQGPAAAVTPDRHDLRVQAGHPCPRLPPGAASPREPR